MRKNKALKKITLPFFYFCPPQQNYQRSRYSLSPVVYQLKTAAINAALFMLFTDMARDQFDSFPLSWQQCRTGAI